VSAAEVSRFAGVSPETAVSLATSWSPTLSTESESCRSAGELSRAASRSPTSSTRGELSASAERSVRSAECETDSWVVGRRRAARTSDRCSLPSTGDPFVRARGEDPGAGSVSLSERSGRKLVYIVFCVNCILEL